MDRTIFNNFSAAEQAYAISMLDPFHDSPYRLTGAPSDQLGQSVVLTVNQEIVVNAATFGLPVTSGSKFDLHVTALPLSRQSNAYHASHNNTNRYVATSVGVESSYATLFPLSISGVNTGDPTFVNSASITGIGSDLPYFTSNSGTAFQDARCFRVIGQSFEVVDETPQLYKQGSVTVYTRNSCNAHVLQNLAYIGEGAVTYTNFTGWTDEFLAPPNRIQQATIIPDSKTWMAQEGAYVVAKPTTLSPKFVRPGISMYSMIAPTDPVNADLENCWFAREGVNSYRATTQPSYTNDITFVTPFNVSGAYLTGLNSEFGVYRIRSKINYEIIPDPSDTTLISQATPTLPRNPQFETILFQTICGLPAGWPQTSNPRGEVWRSVVKVIGMTAQALSPMVANLSDPVSKAFAIPLQAAGMSMVKWADNQERKQKQKQKKSKNSNDTQSVPILGKGQQVLLLEGPKPNRRKAK